MRTRQVRLRLLWWAVATLLAAVAGLARAHEFTLDAVVNTFVKVDASEAHVVVRAPLYLFKSAKFPVRGTEVDVEQAAAALDRALAGLQQGLTLTEDGRPLIARSAVARLALPSDRSFDDYERAALHVATPVDPDTRIVVDQGYVDAHLTYSIASPNGVFALRSTIAPELGNYLKVTVRYLPKQGESRALMIRSGAGAVDLNPTASRAASGFVGLGIAHIATGFDHLQFVLCLIIPLRGLRQLLTIVTAFTLAHTFTLLGSAFGLAPQGSWFAPFVEMLIALSIVYTALENIVDVNLPRRVLLAMAFGLVHGFAFSQGLQQELQFAGSHLLVALFAFNIGIEIGQVIALALMLPLLWLVMRYMLKGRIGSIILAALIAHVGWHWMTDRWDALAKTRWPSLDLANVTSVLFWAAGLALAAGAVLVAVGRLRLGAPCSSMRGSERPG